VERLEGVCKEKVSLPWDGDWRSRPGVEAPSSASTEKTGFWLNAVIVLEGLTSCVYHW
jgi:hypothetical protein